LILLADCFYLPYSEGPEAERLLMQVDRLLAEPTESWGATYPQFLDVRVRIQALFDRLTELRDRELFDAWSRRTWELREELQLIDAFLVQKRAGRDIVGKVELENYLPGTFRGGILTKLQRFLTMDAHGKIGTGKTP